LIKEGFKNQAKVVFIATNSFLAYLKNTPVYGI